MEQRGVTPFVADCSKVLSKAFIGFSCLAVVLLCCVCAAESLVPQKPSNTMMGVRNEAGVAVLGCALAVTGIGGVAQGELLRR